MTKPKLLQEMESAKRDWEKMLSTVADESAHITQPGAEGDWSVKDVIFHCTEYARFYVDALEAHFRGEPPPLDGTSYATEPVGIDERNRTHFEQSRHRSVESVLSDARRTLRRLVELVQLQPEQFLIEPQHFQGVPEPVLVWEGLHHTCDHYRDHLKGILAWLETGPQKTAEKVGP